MANLDPNIRVNLQRATVLAIDASTHSLEVISQMVRGFGVSTVHRCDTLEEADKVLKKAIDLIIIDPAIGEGDGYKYVRDLRHSAGPNAYTPIVLVNGHMGATDVGRARNAGANFVVAKPLSAKVLLERVLWVVRDKRPFVEVSSGYIGPDRRFKFEGPPAASEGRRSTDLSGHVGDAKEANLSQDELDSMFKPQRIAQ